MVTSLLRKTPPRFRLGIFLLLGAGMLVAFVFFSFHQRSSPPVAQPSPTQIILQRASAHLTLPSGQPTIQQIKDAELRKRENPAFYQNAQTGDWVLSFPTMIILYRLSTDRIIATLPVSL